MLLLCCSSNWDEKFIAPGPCLPSSTNFSLTFFSLVNPPQLQSPSDRKTFHLPWPLTISVNTMIPIKIPSMLSILFMVISFLFDLTFWFIEAIKFFSVNIYLLQTMLHPSFLFFRRDSFALHDICLHLLSNVKTMKRWKSYAETKFILGNYITSHLRGFLVSEKWGRLGAIEMMHRR